MALESDTYRGLLEFRVGLRRFLRWSEQQAHGVGLTPTQHQLLLAVAGHPDQRGPTIGEIADYLLLRHHSAVGLIDRAATAGLVKRVRDEDDHRVVHVLLTDDGARRLETVSTSLLEELHRLSVEAPSTWEGLVIRQRHDGLPEHPATSKGSQES
jgi:DNA-binding MarR family transcriptional regulator